MIPRPPARRKPDFSLAMINIVFLLLMFFLVSGSIVQKVETLVVPPLAEELPLERLPRPLLVLDRDGAARLDGVVLALDEIAAHAREKTQGSSLFVNILAERDMPARPMLEIIERLTAAGVPARIVTLSSDKLPAGGSP